MTSDEGCGEDDFDVGQALTQNAEVSAQMPYGYGDQFDCSACAVR